MKGVEGTGRGAGDDGEERDEGAREELELALSLGRRGWHLPARQEPAPRSLNWTEVLLEWNPDAAGSSRAAGSGSGGQPTSSLGLRDMLGGIIPDGTHAGGSVEAAWADEEDEDRDMQNKRLRVRGFGE
ncbi:hypothetical protein PR202_ga00141 [Eleusine coracana subsp. coracana]|uniref:Uncharacterized protein n=1 Tax=Eleusine coracana subsp. coracana TaxID=191504 RepID=A0AAV5BCR9_ELECO|nr:hypothetical protein PR202_ga00141 [Eleusine coracana subsp. coracana]